MTYPHNWSVKALAKMCFPGIGAISPPYGERGGWVGIGVQPQLLTASTGSVGLAPSHRRAVPTEAATPTNLQKLVIRWIASDGWMIIGIYFSPAIYSFFLHKDFERAGRGESDETAESGVGLVRIPSTSGDERALERTVCRKPAGPRIGGPIRAVVSNWSPAIGPVSQSGYAWLARRPHSRCPRSAHKTMLGKRAAAVVRQLTCYICS